jgi:hypothetical protein
MKPFFEIDIRRPRKGARDSARSIYEQLVSAIRDGRLSAGSRRSTLAFRATRLPRSTNDCSTKVSRLPGAGPGRSLRLRASPAPPRDGNRRPWIS